MFGEMKRGEEQLTNCMAQYEERLRRVNEYMEQSSSSYLRGQEEIKATRAKYEDEYRQREIFIQKLLQKSTEIKRQVLTIDEKKNPGKKNIFSQAQIGEMMNELEIQITKLLEIKDESGSAMGDMRDHLIDIYQRMGVGLLKRHQVYEEQLQKLQQEWRATCDKLMEDNFNTKLQSTYLNHDL